MLRHRSFDAALAASIIPFKVSEIFRSRAPPQIVQPIVFRMIIPMQAFMPRRRRANEGLQNEVMNVDPVASPERQMHVPRGFCRWCKQFPLEFALAYYLLSPDRADPDFDAINAPHAPEV
jgi:hypothetical protein